MHKTATLFTYHVANKIMKNTIKQLITVSTKHESFNKCRCKI